MGNLKKQVFREDTNLEVQFYQIRRMSLHECPYAELAFRRAGRGAANIIPAGAGGSKMRSFSPHSFTKQNKKNVRGVIYFICNRIHV